MYDFVLDSPEVIQLRAVQASDDTEPHLDWHVSYSDQRFTFDERVCIPIIGSLHSGGPAGWGDISVAALLVVLGDSEPEQLEDVIAPSNAVETLYDVARGHLLPLLASVGSLEPLPRKSPPASVSKFDSQADSAEASPEDSLTEKP
ncbi:MAG: hypothetical protein FJW64_10305 [Actinobacteria bacterium]|nr:hypothetical protein [Actinomycetota bacterium]